MSGRHAATSHGRHMFPPVPDVKQSTVEFVVPNRERLAYLTYLADRFAPMPGFCTGFGYRNLEPVLYVVTVPPASKDLAPGIEPPSPRGVTVGCAYEDGHWWFVRGGDGSRFAAANDLSTAANIIRRAIEAQAVPA